MAITGRRRLNEEPMERELGPKSRKAKVTFVICSRAMSWQRRCRGP
jgi:hypothetical protein